MHDSVMDAAAKMSDGNPGAITVILRMIEEGDKIDPQSWSGGLGAILHMDTNKIYGPRIWMLYKDVAGENLTTMLALLRATQIGVISAQDLDKAIDSYGEGLDVPAIETMVRDRLPEFGRTKIVGKPGDNPGIKGKKVDGVIIDEYVIIDAYDQEPEPATTDE